MRYLYLLITLCCLLCSNIASAQTITKVIFNSPTGDYIGQGQQFTCGPDNGYITDAHSNFFNGVTVTLHTSNYSAWWQIDFAAINHDALSIGSYPSCVRFPMGTTAQNQVQVSGSGRGCNTLTGSFIIKELTWSSPTQVGSFWATLEQNCEGFMPPLKVEILYNMPLTTPTTTSSWGRLKTMYR